MLSQVRSSQPSIQNYRDTYEVLSFAQKYRARAVTILTEQGEVTATPLEALENFMQISPGEVFTLLRVSFGTSNSEPRTGTIAS